MSNTNFARLAFRVEGKWWVTYMAPTDTMANAAPIGRILMTLAAVPAVKSAYMEAMKVAFAEAIKAATGSAPTEFETRAAPESERAGNA